MEPRRRKQLVETVRVRNKTRMAAALLLVFLAVRSVLACADFAAAPDSRWRTERADGVDWLITPCGDRFFSIGVNIVDGGARARIGAQGYYWRAFAPTLEGWAQRARERLLAWGFNTAGAWSLGPRRLDMPATIELSLGRRLSFVWTDPFDPDLPSRVMATAKRLVLPYKGDPRRIGYFYDNEIGWWNGPLFTAYSSYPPANHTKQRLVRMLRDRYHGDWTAFERDFEPPANVRSFDNLLQETHATTRLRPGGRGIGAVREWTRLFAENYYRMMSEAIRAADPEALYLGDRLPIYYDPDAVRAMAPYVDVIAMNYNVDGPGGWIARYYFEGLRRLASRPVLVTEWFFAAHQNRTGNLNRTGPPKTRQTDTDPSHNINLTGHLMTVATQKDRAAGAGAAAQALAREPSVVGLHWFQFYDDPKGGRFDGEDYNFGLVDVNDRPYEEVTATFRRWNPRLAKLHGQGRPTLAAGTVMLPYAAPDPTDSSLADWPLDAALLPLQAAPAETVFGDLYAAWSGRGLSLATIAMDYYDPELLAHDGAFPRSEAFHIDLGLDTGTGAQRFTLLVVPDRANAGQGTSGFHIEFCRVTATGCVAVSGIAARYFGVALDQPRVILEALLPWSALGLEAPQTASLRLAVGTTSFYRARWMSSTGAEPDRLLAESSNWPAVQLQGFKEHRH